MKELYKKLRQNSFYCAIEMGVMCSILILVIMLICGRLLPAQKSETDLQKEYIEYLKADSNKVVVGFRYVIKESENMTECCEIINPEYKSLFIDQQYTYYAPRMYNGFTEKNVWEFRIKDLKSGWDYRNVEEYRKLIDARTYLRCEEIKMSLTPTFEGFVEWKESQGSKSFEDLLFEYERECYNDSTRLYRWTYGIGSETQEVWREWGDAPSVFYDYSLTSDYKYIHKEPDFAEFLKWIKDQ